MSSSEIHYRPHPKDWEGTVLTGVSVHKDEGYPMVSGPRSFPWPCPFWGGGGGGGGGFTQVLSLVLSKVLPGEGDTPT